MDYHYIIICGCLRYTCLNREQADKQLRKLADAGMKEAHVYRMWETVDLKNLSKIKKDERMQLSY